MSVVQKWCRLGTRGLVSSRFWANSRWVTIPTARQSLSMKASSLALETRKLIGTATAPRRFKAR